MILMMDLGIDTDWKGIMTEELIGNVGSQSKSVQIARAWEPWAWNQEFKNNYS